MGRIQNHVLEHVPGTIHAHCPPPPPSGRGMALHKSITARVQRSILKEQVPLHAWNIITCHACAKMKWTYGVLLASQVSGIQQ